jgi:hypothetical protein
VSGYSYAGWDQFRSGLYSVSGRLWLDAVHATGTHFAMWIGVEGEASDGEAWVQVGVEQEAGVAVPHLYVEVRQPGVTREWHDLGQIAFGEQFDCSIDHGPSGWMVTTPRVTLGPFHCPTNEASFLSEAEGNAAGQGQISNIRVNGAPLPRSITSAVPYLDPGWTFRHGSDYFVAARSLLIVHALKGKRAIDRLGAYEDEALVELKGAIERELRRRA